LFIRPLAMESISATAAGPACLLPLAILARLLGIETGSKPLIAELIVDLALFRIRERLICLGNTLEFLLSVFVSGIDVRMVLPRELPVSLLDLFGGRVSA
jgi:hypothetical protein